MQEFHTRYSQSYKAGHSMWKTKLTSIGTTALASHLTTITVAISPALAKYLFAGKIEPPCSVVYQLSNAPSNFCGIFSNTWRKYVFTCERIYITDFFAHSHTHIHKPYVRPSVTSEHIPAFSRHLKKNLFWLMTHVCLAEEPTISACLHIHDLTTTAWITFPDETPFRSEKKQNTPLILGAKPLYEKVY